MSMTRKPLVKMAFRGACPQIFQTSFRRQVFNCFCELMLHDFSEYPEPVRRSLWEEFCRRAGATDSEKAEAYRNLYEDYKIVYP